MKLVLHGITYLEMVMKEAIETPVYYPIPGFSRYGVTREGVVINHGTQEILTGSTNPVGYHNYRLTGDDGNCLTWGRHRLLGFVFLHPDKDIADLMVNHINAIKGDDVLSNLEWVTCQGNIEHAGALGLTTKCVPVSVRDVDTGELDNYPSFIECARTLGLSKDAIAYRVKIGESRVFPERKQYRASTVSTPWFIPEDIDRALMSNSTSKPVQLRYALTGEVLEFDKLTQLAEHLKISPSTVTLRMNIPNQPMLPGYIQLKWLDDPTPWRVVDDPYLDLARCTGKRPVVAINNETNEAYIFSTLVECASILVLKVTALHHRLKSAGKTVFADGFRYSYYSDYIASQSH